MKSESVFYHSWKEKFKKPFGAVQKNDTVRFQFYCETKEQAEVDLVLHKDFGRYFEISMEQTKEENLFACTFQLSEGSGLYFYHFRIKITSEATEQTYYYGNNERELGGKGALTEKREEVR